MRYLLFCLAISISLQLSAQSGKLLLIGGGNESSGNWADAPYQWALQQSNNQKVAIISYNTSSNFYVDYFEGLGAVEAKEIQINSREAADFQTTYDELMKYDIFFFRGGNQWEYYSLYKDTKTAKAIEDKFAEGGVIAGTSAGLAILSEVVFTAENGALYPDEALGDIGHEKITLADDFLDLPLSKGFVFDSHFIERGRFARLAAFMAHWELWKDEKLTGIGVDDKTALAIDENGMAKVFGSGAVSFFSDGTMDITFSGKLQIEDMRWQQLIHGDVIDLNTLQVEENTFEQFSNNTFNSENLAASIVLGGSNDLQESGGVLHSLFSKNGADLSESTLLVIGDLDVNEIEELIEVLEDRGFYGYLSIFMPDEQEEDSVQIAKFKEADYVLFYQVDNEQFADFLEKTEAGAFVKEYLQESDMNIGFLGEAVSWAGHSLAINLTEDSGASFYGELDIRDGLQLLKSMTIVSDTFDDTSADFYENKSAVIPYILLQEELERGLWLNRGGMIQLCPNLETGEYEMTPFYENEALFPPDGGKMPVMELRKTSMGTAFDFVSEPSTSSGDVRQQVGFADLRLSFLGSGPSESISIGDVLTNIEAQKPISIEVYPNPTTGKISFQDLDKNQKYVFQLFDLQGKILKSQTLNRRQEIELQSLSSGVYYFSLLEVGRQNLYIGKVLKQD